MTVRPRPDKSRAAAKPFNDIDAGILALARARTNLLAGATLSTGSQTFEQLQERWRAHGWVVLADFADWASPADHITEDLVRQLGTPEGWPPAEEQATSRAQCTTVRMNAAVGRPERCPSVTRWRDPSGVPRCAWCWGEQDA